MAGGLVVVVVVVKIKSDIQATNRSIGAGNRA